MYFAFRSWVEQLGNSRNVRSISSADVFFYSMFWRLLYLESLPELPCCLSRYVMICLHTFLHAWNGFPKIGARRALQGLPGVPHDLSKKGLDNNYSNSKITRTRIGHLNFEVTVCVCVCFTYILLHTLIVNTFLGVTYHNMFLYLWPIRILLNLGHNF